MHAATTQVGQAEPTRVEKNTWVITDRGDGPGLDLLQT